jgi:hypothetical protein
VAKNRMTLDAVDSARRRVVTMFANFGEAASAAEFDAMTAEEYAERKGIEVINSNPKRRRRTGKMSMNRKQHEQLRSYINSITDDALTSNSRADLRATMEEINDITGEEVALVFNGDGTVEVERSEAEDANDFDDEEQTDDD